MIQLKDAYIRDQLPNWAAFFIQQNGQFSTRRIMLYPVKVGIDTSILRRANYGNFSTREENRII
ncbi:hypothetical protein OSK38_29785, partial [Escherichia coli]|nr:hypothetical protein [Escherichia coli]